MNHFAFTDDELRLLRAALKATSIAALDGSDAIVDKHELLRKLEAVPSGRFDVHTVVERNDKSYWHKLGRGYANRDGSINVYLDALPVNGKLQIRVEGEETPK